MKSYRRKTESELETKINLYFNPLSESDKAELELARPKTRSDCENGIRPCPFASCRYNTYLDVDRKGRITFNYSESVEELKQSNCALDYDQGRNLNDTELASALGISREYLGTVTIPMVMRKINRLKDLVDMPNQRIGNLAGAQEGFEGSGTLPMHAGRKNG